MFRSQNNLACQARAIINSKLLTEHELRDVKQCAILTETDPSSALISSIPRSEELVDNVSEFERLLVCVEECLTDATISEDLREAFQQILACLSDLDGLEFTVRSALPRLTENKLVKK